MLTSKLKDLRNYLLLLSIISLIFIGFNLANIYKFFLEEKYFYKEKSDYAMNIATIKGDQAYLIYKINSLIKAKKMNNSNIKTFNPDYILHTIKELADNFNINDDIKIDIMPLKLNKNNLKSSVMHINARSSSDTNLVSFFSSFINNLPSFIEINKFRLERISNNPVIIEGNFEIEYYIKDNR